MAKRYKVKEKRHFAVKKSRIVYMIAAACYLIVVIGATVYAQTVYIDNLPKVTLSKAQSREIEYTLRATAVVQGNTITYTVSQRRAIVRDVMVKGCKVEIGTEEKSGNGSVKSVSENSAGEMTIVIEVESGSFDRGEVVNIAVEGKTRVFEKTVPVSAMTINGNGQTAINTIVEEEGPWGKRYVIREETVPFYWPNDGGSEYVLIPPDAIKGVPVLNSIEADFVYDGMEVRIVE